VGSSIRVAFYPVYFVSRLLDEFLPKAQKLLESVRWKQKLLENTGFWRA
jgi:hypothetical protein